MKKDLFFAIPLILLILLAAACSRTAERPPFLPPPETSPPPDMAVKVATDYSGLTPYAHPHAKHTRLHDGPLPELVPSEGYGMLLPYASADAMPSGAFIIFALLKPGCPAGALYFHKPAPLTT